MKILVIGANGMIGSTVFQVLSDQSDWTVWGSVRDDNAKRFFSITTARQIISGVNADNLSNLVKVLDQTQPDVVINCAGITKHKPEADDPLVAIPINTLMPHQLAGLCKLIGARLIHVSTDCVFSGEKGNYLETDDPDARDVYGKSKTLGELFYPHTVTLRTSTIGHELDSKYGLLDWFLSQDRYCNGYKLAIFSGLPTVVFAEILRDLVIPNSTLSGLYHVAADPITKYNLLKLIAEIYKKTIDINIDESFKIDRSLNSFRFQQATGYVAPPWRDLITKMHCYQEKVRDVQK